MAPNGKKRNTKNTETSSQDKTVTEPTETDPNFDITGNLSLETITTRKRGRSKNQKEEMNQKKKTRVIPNQGIQISTQEETTLIHDDGLDLLETETILLGKNKAQKNDFHESQETAILKQLHMLSEEIKAVRQVQEDSTLQQQLLAMPHLRPTPFNTIRKANGSENNRDESIGSTDSMQPRTSQQFHNLTTAFKMLSRFSGEKSGNFEGWVMNTRLLLTNVHLSETDKKTVVLLKIEGAARKIVENAGNLDSMEDIFATLASAYGEDEIDLLSNTKQRAEEPVKAYFVRLKTNLHLIGFKESKKSESVLLDYFLEGLLPSLADKVKGLYPYNMDHALKLATRLEAAQAHTREGRKIKRNLETLNQVSNNSFEDRLNLLASQVNKIAATKSTHSHQNKNNNNNQRGFNEYRGTCFACQKVGHNYIRCPTATAEKISDIRENFSKYLAEYRAGRNKNSSNSNGVSTRPQ